MASQSAWLQEQFASSASALLWAVERHPPENLYIPPRSDRWSAARSVYHMVVYEQRFSLPSLLQWEGGVRPTLGTQEEEAEREEQVWDGGSGHPMERLIADFNGVRAQQIEMLVRFDEQRWGEERETTWGSRPLAWVVTKTYQHTLEHTNEILRAYLWWGKYHPAKTTSTGAS